MTSARSAAYGRVVATIRELGPAKLWPHEAECIREAADALLFCDDLSSDGRITQALRGVTALGDNLIASARWTAERTFRLLDDIWACGPEGDVEALAAYP